MPCTGKAMALSKQSLHTLIVPLQPIGLLPLKFQLVIQYVDSDNLRTNSIYGTGAMHGRICFYRY